MYTYVGIPEEVGSEEIKLQMCLASGALEIEVSVDGIENDAVSRVYTAIKSVSMELTQLTYLILSIPKR